MNSSSAENGCDFELLNQFVTIRNQQQCFICMTQLMELKIVKLKLDGAGFPVKQAKVGWVFFDLSETFGFPRTENYNFCKKVHSVSEHLTN